MQSGTSALGNLAELYHCLQSGGSGHCTLFTGGDSGFGIALVIVSALNIGGIVLSHLGLVLATEPAAERLADRHRLNAAIGAASACLWCYLWLAYALPECTGHTYIAWMIISPLFTLVLMVGFIGMVAAIAFTVRNATSGRLPWGLSGDKWAWALLTTAVTGILIGWRALYEATPQIAAGPYGRGPGWFQDALGIWTLDLPVTALWALAKALATTPGITIFAVLAALSLVLPRRTASARAANLTSGVITTAVGELAGLVISACVLVVVSLLSVAAAALAFMFLAAYLMAYALVVAFLAALVVGAVRR